MTVGGSGDLNGSDPLNRFADRLRGAVKNAGDPSVRALEKLSRDLGNPYSRQTFSQKLNGKSKPDWQFVETLVRACARYAGQDAGQAELAAWRTVHSHLLRELAAKRTDQREQSRGVAGAIAELAMVPPDAEFTKKCASYISELRTRYRDLDHTNALAVRGAPGGAPSLPLREVFIPQWVRAQPPQTELPREVRRDLIAYGRRRNRKMPEDVDREQLDREFKAYADSPKRPVLEVIAEHDGAGIVILGDPGSGKSTLAAYLTLATADLTAASAADEGISSDYEALGGLAGYLPVLLELRTYAPHAETRDFLDEIDRPHKPGHPGFSRRLIEPYLQHGGPALVIFDGLDEVFDAELREDIKWRIRDFATDYPGVRVVVTSRLTGYEPDRRILDQIGFAHYTLQDLEQKQVAVFARGFYSAAYPTDPAKPKALTARLLEAVDRSPGIGELSGNPMLLTALALLALGDDLPRSRRAVLKHMVEILVKRWDAEKYLEKYLQPRPAIRELEFLDVEEKTRMLGLVARRIQEGNQGAGGLAGNYLSREALIEILTEFFQPDSQEQRLRKRNVARTLVDQFRERDYILAKFGTDTFGFVHRALLDYLAAVDIYAQFSDQDIYPQDIEKLFHQHSAAPEWQEVLLLLAGMLNKPAVFEDAVLALLGSNPLWYLGSDPLPRHVLLAIRCLGEVVYPDRVRPASRAAVDGLITLLETVSGSNDYPLAVALTQALERDVLPVLGRLGPDWAGRPAYETWYLSRGQFLSGDSPGFAATAAAGIYVTLLGRDDKARERLRTLARWADSVMVRGAALEALAQSWSHEPETADLLRVAAADDPDSYVRRLAVGTLAARWGRDPATHDLLCDRITRDDSPAVRGTAIRWLAGGWRDGGTAVLLRAVGADLTVPGEARAVAVAALAAGWHDDEPTEPWLWERADDEDPRVRATVAQALATGWHHDPDTHQWLRRLADATNESSAQVRVAALRALAAGWPELPDTLMLLKAKARAGGDDDPDVRQAAVEALAAGWCDDPETAPWLREHVEKEPDEDVRCAVTQALAAYWPKDQATAKLLEYQALKDDDWYVRATAIQALAGIRAGEPRAGTWLRERATKDPAPYVRLVALSAAAAGWHDDPETTPWLRRRASEVKEDLDVRAAAVRALAAGWHEDQETLPLLRAVGVGNARTGAARRVAVQSVAVGWRDCEETRIWVRERATDDDSPAVRRTALQLLAADTRWHDDPGTLALLRNTAVSDRSAEVRKAAIRTLSAGWYDDPATAGWLRDHAFARLDQQGKVAVIRTLATDWHDDAATAGWLRGPAAADPDPEVRQGAAHWLARGWPGTPGQEGKALSRTDEGSCRRHVLLSGRECLHELRLLRGVDVRVPAPVGEHTDGPSEVRRVGEDPQRRLGQSAGQRVHGEDLLDGLLIQPSRVSGTQECGEHGDLMLDGLWVALADGGR